MLSATDRLLIERVRRAERLTITATLDTGDTITFDTKGKGDSKKLKHDVAIALQDYINRLYETAK